MVVDRAFDPRCRAQQLCVAKPLTNELNAYGKIPRAGKAGKGNGGNVEHSPKPLKQQIARGLQPFRKRPFGHTTVRT
jgi:hypothetical protein